MIIVLTKEENLEIKCNTCPRCYVNYNMKKNKRTKHHIIPQFMKPKSVMTIELCLECHEELNSFYRHPEISGRKYRYKSENFNQFIETYEKLKREFQDKKLNRGQFGEGLWSNLVSYLKSTNEKG